MLTKEEILKYRIDSHKWGYRYSNIESTEGTMNDFLNISLAAMDEYANQDKWISADLAPKDGTRIIGYDPNTEEIYTVWWNRSMGYGCWNYEGNQYIPKITHFQPLPTPPKQ